MATTLADLTAAQAAADEAIARLEVLALSVVSTYVRSLTPDVAFLRLVPGRGGRLMMGDGLTERMEPLVRDDEVDVAGFTDAMSALAHVDDDGWWVEELTRPCDDGFVLLLDVAAVEARASK